LVEPSGKEGCFLGILGCRGLGAPPTMRPHPLAGVLTNELLESLSIRCHQTVHLLIPWSLSVRIDRRISGNHVSIPLADMSRDKNRRSTGYCEQRRANRRISGMSKEIDEHPFDPFHVLIRQNPRNPLFLRQVSMGRIEPSRYRVLTPSFPASL